MTIERARESPGITPASAAEPDRVLVAVIAGSTKIGVVLDAEAPVSAQLAALVDLINGRLTELRGGSVDGRPARPLDVVLGGWHRAQSAAVADCSGGR